MVRGRMMTGRLGQVIGLGARGAFRSHVRNEFAEFDPSGGGRRGGQSTELRGRAVPVWFVVAVSDAGWVGGLGFVIFT